MKNIAMVFLNLVAMSFCATFQSCAPVIRDADGVRVVGDIVHGDRFRTVTITASDQKRILEIARFDHEPIVRAAAVRKLQDRSALLDIVARDSDQNVRIAVVETLSDPRDIFAVAMNNSDPLVRIAAADKITDKNMLREI